MGTKKTFLSRFWHYLPFGCFLVAVFCLCFTYGIAVGKWHVFPHRFLDAGFDSLKSIVVKERPHYLHPVRYEGEGVVVCKRDKVWPGVTLLTGLWKDEDDFYLGLRLVDLDGTVLHEWKCNPEDIWDHSPYDDIETGQHDRKTKTWIHGVLLLPDGDVILNLEWFTLVRLNKHSQIVWKLPRRTHHSMFQSDNGNIWVCGVKYHENRVPEYPGLKPPFIEDTILEVSLDGTVENEISILQAIYSSGYSNLIFTSKRYTFYEVLHLNDIEVLSERRADAFKLFKAGDIMVSMRDINTICVLDGKTERIKWSLTHPFIAQHDPDFTEDGYITVFDNNQDVFGGSRILRIEPSSRKVEILYGHKEDQYFFTDRCGKHQQLPNGNILITEAYAGRVFEITMTGEIVWSWIAPRWGKNSVPEISEGIRYGAEYAEFTNGLRKNEK